MSKKKIQLNQSETQLIEGIRKHPDLLERLQSILDIASSTQGPLRSADEVEELLIQEMRRLGKSTMENWASTAEERVAQDLKAKDSSVTYGKKKR